MLETIIVILGLTVFEVISSIDNAVVNAHVLKTMPEKYRKIFMFWGILFAVFVVRGILPFVIVWIANPGLSFTSAIHFVFNPTPELEHSVEQSKPFLLLGGGMYMVLVFLGWLFLEEKKYAFMAEAFIHRRGFWFYAISSVFLTLMIYFAIKQTPFLALSAAIGASAFFITDGFKKNAEEAEKKMVSGGSHMSAWSKILYLEILDASFSIDGVVGAFAFTMSVSLIIIGNGIGAFVVREMTVRGINLIGKFAYLKNGAMYSIGFLGAIMTFESFGHEMPFWLAPIVTVALLVYFLYLSRKEIAKIEKRLHI